MCRLYAPPAQNALIESVDGFEPLAVAVDGSTLGEHQAASLTISSAIASTSSSVQPGQ